MKSFLFGLGLGLGLGILFAPMSGEDTRQNLSDRANDLANTARGSYEQGRDRVRETYTQGRERVQRGVEALRDVGRAVSEARDHVSEPTGTSL
jgi:gas vesicle protein